MGFIEAVKHAFAHYGDFSTRSTRSQYWWWVLFWFLFTVLAIVTNGIIFGPTIEQSNSGPVYTYDGGPIGKIFQLLVLIPFLAVNCRRLHDINKSGWWQLLMFVPVIGWLILLYWFVKPGDDGENRFGWLGRS